MGYHTRFEGKLEFTEEPTAGVLARIKATLGEDRREHPEWEAPDDFYYVDLAIAEDFTGITWDDNAEKTYGMSVMVEWLIGWVRREYPTFGLRGVLRAQGEDWDDSWQLHVDGAEVRVNKTPPAGEPVVCPNCEAKFVPGETP